MEWPRKSWTDLMNDSLKKEDGMSGKHGERHATRMTGRDLRLRICLREESQNVTRYP